MTITLTVNGKKQKVDADPSTPLLWLIRDHLNLTGTKFGCGMSLCGACTVHIDGKAVRSCTTPISSLKGKSITTIEGLQSAEATAVTNAWQDLAVVQCGYCQSGQIMSATALLREKPNPTDTDIHQFMAGNICRCATYQRIRNAIKQAATDLASKQAGSDETPLYTEITLATTSAATPATQAEG